MNAWLAPDRTPLVVAHRGSSSIAPENTLAAFARARADGADAVELDVRLSLDGEAMVIHDRRLDRTTDGSGLVGERTAAELRSLSAGGWFSRSFASERVPRLSDVFDALPGFRINVEIKSDKPAVERELVRRCCTLIRKHGVGGTILVSSFSGRALRLVRSLAPSLPTGLLYHPVRHFGRPAPALARSLGAQYLILNSTALRKRLAGNMHSTGGFAGEYVVGTPRRLARALRYGVDAVYTNDPARLTRLLKRP
jgi:glycerophosphoryl diester phosphodiesterase